ncbi:hypothetical protein ACL02S_23915 [Nocardia sp. 004]|uniref:hypothetical protein n=1 Tax=Nocardia sp. 004 TaxID=3385978 RepID=UPI0039A110D4
MATYSVEFVSHLRQALVGGTQRGVEHSGLSGQGTGEDLDVVVIEAVEGAERRYYSLGSTLTQVR